MAFEGSVEDRLSIRELIEAYSDAVFRRDEAAWAATWTDDGVWNLMGTEVMGKANLVAAWRHAMTEFTFTAFFSVPGEIRVVNRDSGTARVYASEYLVQADGRIRHVIGQYHDALLKTRGRWLFRRRTYRILRDE
jgi:uncharacterized protein (TIGR02246 family)